MNTVEKGTLSEAAVLAALVLSGNSVLVPWGVARYDLAIDEGGQLKRLQVKTGRVRDGVIIFNGYSSPAGLRRAIYTESEIDAFAVYSPERNEVYIVPVNEVSHEGRLRLAAPKNNQSKGVKLASDYLLR